MKIEQLQFVAAEPIAKTLKLGDNEYTVHIKRISFGDLERIGNSPAALIRHSVIFDDDQKFDRRTGGTSRRADRRRAVEPRQRGQRPKSLTPEGEFMCELAATIGGSLEDVKRLPYQEVMQWRDYAQKHGGLPLTRLVTLMGTLCHMFNAANGGKANLHDFLPAVPDVEMDTEITDASQMISLGWR
ncbi:MAG: hypothetical protein QM739_17935 [Propionivibrio sp.]